MQQDADALVESHVRGVLRAPDARIHDPLKYEP
jgi:hypothetical protein